MIKMAYPTDKAKVQLMNDAYFKNIQTILGNLVPIDGILCKIKMVDGTDLSCKKLLTAPFQELAGLNTEIEQLTDAEKATIAPITDYKKGQPLAAKFFIEQKELQMSSCFYCNIDSIYSFSMFADYWGPLDFVQRADLKQLQLIDSLGPAKAKIILEKRAEKMFEKMEDLPLTPLMISKINALTYKATHSHFTLDHFHHQANYQYLRLCLYNFVPSCYVCNSKFKSDRALFITKPEASSPSSNLFSFHNDVRFKVYFAHGKTTNLSLQDFAVDMEVSANNDSHNQYLDVLRLRGRYVHHKRLALRLLKLKEDYPKERLEELSESLKMSIEEIKRMIFGAELFDAEFDNSSLIKYKRDVAKSIKLLNP